jgi:peptide/nickel transport system permease protein
VSPTNIAASADFRGRAPDAGAEEPRGPRRVLVSAMPRAADWATFLARRLLGALCVVGVLVVLTFAIVRLVPGDPARNVAGLTASPAALAATRHRLGLDKSLFDQFTSYVSGLLRGDLGSSFQDGEPISRVLRDRLPSTFELALASLVVVLIGGIALGMLTAGFARRNRLVDHGITTVTSLGGAAPEYVTGTILVLIFGVKLGLLPVAQNTGPESAILPVCAVAVAPTCVLIRIMRREVLRTLGKEYIVTARSKHLPRWRLYLFHVLPNASTAALTVGGLLLAGLLGGTVTVEAVFAWPGLGTAVVQAIKTDNYPVIQGVVLVLGMAATVITLAVDILLAAIDPRTRSARIDRSAA